MTENSEPLPYKSTSYVRKRNKNGDHYIDNIKFQEEMENYISKYNEAIKNNVKLPRISEFIGDCFIKLSTKLSESPSFRGFSFKDEMVSEGIENCIKYAHRFNPEMISKFYTEQIVKVKAYSYFTTVIVRAFIRKIQSEEHNKYISIKAYKNTMLFFGPESNGTDLKSLTAIKLHDNIEEFVEKYEKKLQEKKEKTAESNKKVKVPKGLSLYLDTKIVSNNMSGLL